MSMATVQFYHNPYNYPDYQETLTSVTSQLTCTPKGTTQKGGQLHVGGLWGELSEYTYLAFRRDGTTVWAWVDNVTERTANSAVIDYTVDPWRTYKNKVNLGTQFIARQPDETELYDNLLAGYDQAMEQDVIEHSWATTNKRIFVVQARRGDTSEVLSNHPVQPTPYNIYVTEYDPDDWQGSAPHIEQLLSILEGGAQASNIVTAYSIPYMNISNVAALPLTVYRPDADSVDVTGFKKLHANNTGIGSLLTRSKPLALNVNTFELMQVNHDVKVMIPGAGILNVPDEAIKKGSLKVRQDVDLFSGGSNFMLTCGTNNDVTGQSVRGSSVSSIPILSDPYDTYMSQNQNSLTTSMIGDVATLGAGIGMMATGNPMGAASTLGGVRGLVGRGSQMSDLKNMLPSNPPAMLGTALSNTFNNLFYSIVTYDGINNRQDVHNTFGYPVNMVKALTLPASGFIQTQNCNVIGNGTVPRWALQEINELFDNGIRIR